ncbi:MFS transporter [Natronocalculus amylovorans]|uniref:MFS transporter n=1 Tax=Natronocalculus amylovorans TaxID=2917812 RepID=A0AAE3K8C4_9EURY|nr:MFS transporter [Natronocalculus amylovorans]MCL9816911.1 MFS transporter [Natronocalculus amylovorans]
MDREDNAIAGFTGLSHGTFHGFELSIPLFVPIWIAAFDASPAVIGVVVGAGYAIIGLGSPLAGVLADQYGSKQLVLVSIAGMGLSFAAISLTTSIVTLAIALIIWGAAASIYHPAGLSLISRNATQRGTVLGYHGAGGSLGTVIVPLVAIALLSIFDWRIVIVLLAVPSMIALFIGALLQIDESTASSNTDGEPSGRPLTDALRSFVTDSRQLLVGGFVIVLAIQMVYGMYYRGIFTFLPDVLSGLPIFEPVTIGERTVEAGQLAYSGLLLVGVFGQYAGGALSDRVDPERTVVVTFCILIAASLLFVPASEIGVLPLLAVCAVLGFFIYAFAPIGQTLVAEYVADDSHGLSFGFVYFGTFGVGAIGAAVAGAVLDFGTLPLLFIVLSGFLTVCAALGVLLVKKAA